MKKYMLRKKVQKVVDSMSLAFSGEKADKDFEALKQELRNNDFKLCGLGVDIMLSQMADQGMSEESVAYYKTLGMTRLPYEPAKALKD